jgi:hypothetical protein
VGVGTIVKVPVIVPVANAEGDAVGAGTIVEVLGIVAVNDAVGNTIGVSEGVREPTGVPDVGLGVTAGTVNVSVAVELGIFEATWVGVLETATVCVGGTVLRAAGEPVKVAVGGAIFFPVGVAEMLAREFPLIESSTLLVNIKKPISIAPTTPRTIQTRAGNPGALCILMGYLPSFSRGLRGPIFIDSQSIKSHHPFPSEKLNSLSLFEIEQGEESPLLPQSSHYLLWHSSHTPRLLTRSSELSR